MYGQKINASAARAHSAMKATSGGMIWNGSSSTGSVLVRRGDQHILSAADCGRLEARHVLHVLQVLEVVHERDVRRALAVRVYHLVRLKVHRHAVDHDAGEQ